MLDKGIFFNRVCNDIFDITPTGVITWNTAMQLYEKKLERVEEQIIHILDDRLNLAKSADEMFSNPCPQNTRKPPSVQDNLRLDLLFANAASAFLVVYFSGENEC